MGYGLKEMRMRPKAGRSARLLKPITYNLKPITQKTYNLLIRYGKAFSNLTPYQ